MMKFSRLFLYLLFGLGALILSRVVPVFPGIWVLCIVIAYRERPSLVIMGMLSLLADILLLRSFGISALVIAILTRGIDILAYERIRYWFGVMILALITLFLYAGQGVLVSWKISCVSLVVCMAIYSALRTTTTVEEIG